ncbi:Alkyl hydroperoxide reductase/ Thiol specific antioxidant/ Mal allergen domain protein [Candidatus Magnetobacterium bavaricum]|uniref:Alkyl hydroperoxide reductase/ Thiol specific antioxidant/ Mal allergen domain protein n=1 Tax=Candidatus Magnetobacterium bavaricum TaxID=29290 RepID=A0A0F3GPE5_9BACT|nr:Alkyl hydroperoxide reductase/ Thiol specific antioxidant/ Mal allergen domain protein [Candidatus Magnetobacterium bavaricum]
MTTIKEVDIGMMDKPTIIYDKLTVVLRLLFLLSLALLMLPAPGSAMTMVKEGAPAPTFVMIDENNKEVDIGTLMDKPTIIYFTHNACHYCTQIIALLKRAETKFGRKNLRIIGINIAAKNGELVKAYKKELGFVFPMFAGNRQDVLAAYKINYVPVLVFVDANKVVSKIVGHYIHEKELHDYIRSLTNK